MAKIFFTYEQQLNKLQQEKDLIIPDTDAAKLILEKLSYYSLIGGYKELFKHTPSQKYIYGVTFDEIVFFYYFDEELRSLFMKYILHVERHIKSLLSYHFCEKYGENDTEYLDINNYTLTKKNYAQINRLVHSMQKAIALPSQYTYISHHANTYGNVPLWVAMNAFTFGQVSKMFQYVALLSALVRSSSDISKFMLITASGVFRDNKITVSTCVGCRRRIQFFSSV